MDQEPAKETQREFGIQPLDRWMEEFSFENRDLVETSTEQLTYKQVQKARRGRRLSANLQAKVKNALEKALRESDRERVFRREELFNYHP
jgi:hypothetical protein